MIEVARDRLAPYVHLKWRSYSECLTGGDKSHINGVFITVTPHVPNIMTSEINSNSIVYLPACSGKYQKISNLSSIVPCDGNPSVTEVICTHTGTVEGEAFPYPFVYARFIAIASVFHCGCYPSHYTVYGLCSRIFARRMTENIAILCLICSALLIFAIDNTEILNI